MAEPLEGRKLLAAFLTGAASPLDMLHTPVPTYNLTREGTADWAHWNQLNPDGSGLGEVHKSSGSQIANFHLVGTGGTNWGFYPSSAEVGVTWTDGTVGTPSNPEQVKIWMNRDVRSQGYVPAGFSFSVPADTTARTLYVLGGQYHAGTTFTAHLSDGSAQDFSYHDTFYDPDHSALVVRRVYTIDYEAASSGQTLTITFTKTDNRTGDPTDASGSVDLVAAWLAPDVHALTVSPTQIDLTWKDDTVGETGFKIDYSTSPNPSGAATILAGDDTGSKWITGLSPATTYYFRVRTVFGDGTESANSDWVTASTPALPTQTTTIDVTAAPYNADKTGAIDATNAIQAAIDASNPGDTIYFPHGTYEVSSAILAKGEGRVYKGDTALSTDVSNDPAGVTVAGNESTLVSTGSDPGQGIPPPFPNRSNAIFYAKENRPMLDSGSSFNIRFENLTFQGRGVFMDQENALTPMDGVVVDHCHFDVRVGANSDPFGNIGIQFTTGLKDSSIVNNLFNVGGEIGIYGFYWNDHVTIANNDFENKVEGQPQVINEGLHLSDFSPDFGQQTSFNLLVEQNHFSGLSRMGAEIQGGGFDTVIQDNFYENHGEGGYNGSTFGYSIVDDKAITPITRRNYAYALPSNPGPQNGVLVMYELGGLNLQMYDNYSSGGYHVIAVNGTNATGTAYNNRILQFQDPPFNANGATVQFVNNGSGTALTWDLSRPKPGPDRRVFGLALDGRSLVVHGTKLDDSVVVTKDNSTGELTLNLNGEPFTFPASALDTVQFVEAKHLSLLSIGDGTVVQVASHATPNDPDGTIVTQALLMESGGMLDTTNNSMIIDYSGSVGTLVTDTRAYLHDAALISSSADSTHKIGYGDNAILNKATFAGVDVDSTSLLIKFTYGGDANLDGQVDVTDLGALATNWQTANVWTGGDFNYDGFVDVTDLGILATDWQLGVGSPLGPQGGQRPVLGPDGPMLQDPTSYTVTAQLVASDPTVNLGGGDVTLTGYSSYAIVLNSNDPAANIVAYDFANSGGGIFATGGASILQGYNRSLGEQTWDNVVPLSEGRTSPAPDGLTWDQYDVPGSDFQAADSAMLYYQPYWLSGPPEAKVMQKVTFTTMNGGDDATGINDTGFSDSYGDFWSTSTHINGVAALASGAQPTSIAVAYIIVPTGSIEAGNIVYSAGVVDSSNPMQSQTIQGTVEVP